MLLPVNHLSSLTHGPPLFFVQRHRSRRVFLGLAVRMSEQVCSPHKYILYGHVVACSRMFSLPPASGKTKTYNQAPGIIILSRNNMYSPRLGIIVIVSEPPGYRPTPHGKSQALAFLSFLRGGGGGGFKTEFLCVFWCLSWN